jgi:hypothetical protein
MIGSKRRMALVLVGVWLITGCHQRIDSNVPNKLVFLLLGQSNMLGAGQENDYPAINGVTMVNGPLRGPGPSFAAELLKRNPSVKFELRQYALGGSGSSYWFNPSLGSWSGALNGFNDKELSGVLYFQGEADAISKVPTPWAKGFINMVTCIRRDTNNPKLPVIFVQISPFKLPPKEAPWIEHVRREQSSVSMRCVRMINVDDLERNSAMHYSADAYWVIGQRMAKAYQNIERKTKWFLE